MKRIKFTAIFLCLAMIFAMFSGITYAENDVAYIEETTLVIENGEVISGDKSLVENGIVVIGEADDVGSDSVDAPVVNCVVTETSDVVAENIETASEETAENANNTQPGGKQPVKDNTPLLSPDSSTGETQSGTALPVIAPNYITPTTNFPGTILGLRGSNTYNVSNTWDAHQCSAMIMHVPRCMDTANGEFDMNMSVVARGYAYGAGAITTIGTHNSQNFTDAFFRVYNGTLNITNPGNENSKMLTLEGLRLYYNSFDGNNNSIPTSQANTAARWSNTYNSSYSDNYVGWDSGSYPFYPLIVVGGGTANVFDPQGVYIQNNLSSTNGGAILVRAHDSDSSRKSVLSLSDATVRHCKSAKNGGGMAITAGDVTLTRVTFDNCHAAGDGGAIFMSGGTLTMTDCTITNCTATNGGAIYVKGSATITMTNTTISNNTAVVYTQSVEKNYALSSNSGKFRIVSHVVDTGDGSNFTNNYYGDTSYSSFHAGKLNNGTKNMQGNDSIAFNHNSTNAGTAYIVFQLSSKIMINSVKVYVWDTSAVYGAWPSSVKVYVSNTNGTSGTQLSGGSYTGTDLRTYSYGASSGEYQYVIVAFAVPAGGYWVCCNEVEINGYIKPTATSTTTCGGGIYTEADVTMSGGSISSNTAGNGGGVYVNGGDFTMTGGTISGHSATYGGGIYAAAGSDLYIEGGTVENNTASTNGGGIYGIGLSHFIVGTAESTTADRPIIRNNTCSNDGGGICVYQAGVWIYNAEISGNTGKHGGGIYMTDNGATNELKVTIQNGDIINNKNGSGLWLSGAKKNTVLNINGGNISGNTLTSEGHNFGGAGISATQHVTVNITGTASSPVTINNNINSANGGIGTTDAEKNYKYDTSMNGGGIACVARDTSAAEYDGVLTITGNVTISGNSVPSNCTNNYSSKNGMGYGGGIFMEEGGTVIIRADEAGNKPTISNNTAYRGGGVYVEGYTGYTTELTINGAIFSGNVSNEYRYVLDANGNTSNSHSLAGGGACVYKNVTASIKNAQFSGNKASMETGVGGGGLSAIDLTAITVEGCTFTNNYVAARDAAYETNSSITGDGGGIFFRNVGTITLTDNTITGNKAQQGGGIYVIRDSYNESNTSLNTTINVTGCTINNNSDGGVFLQRNSDAATRKITATIGTTTIEGNTLGNYGSHRFGGAGITAVNGITLTLNNGTAIKNNKNTVQLITSKPAEISNIEEVDTSANGGGIAMIRKGTNDWQNCGTLTVNGGTEISGNTAKYGNGGGIYIEDETGTLIISTASNNKPISISGNTVGYEGYSISNSSVADLKNGCGGGIFVGANGKLSLSGTASAKISISNNKAIGGTENHCGGGLYISNNKSTANTDTLEIAYTDFKNNEIHENKGDGGGISCRITNLELVNCSFDGNKALTANSNGGGIDFGSKGYTLKIEDCLFKGNQADGWGGGLYCQNAITATVDNSVFDGNKSRRGGAISLYTTESTNGSMTITNTDMGNNSIEYLSSYSCDVGGAMAVYNFDVSLENCNIGWLEQDGQTVAAPNTAKNLGGTPVGEGGGIYLYGTFTYSDTTTVTRGTLTFVDGVNISNNEAAGNGGGICFGTDANLPVFANVVMNNNSSGKNGGAIYVYRSTPQNVSGKLLQLSSCAFDGNEAAGNGGAVYCENTVLTVSNNEVSGSSVMSDNTAGGSGGAVYVVNTTGATPTVANFFKLSGTLYEDNEANTDKTGNDGFGGAIYVSCANGYITNSEFYGNYVYASTDGNDGNGGAVYVTGTSAANSRLEFSINTVGKQNSGNHADSYGGGLAIGSYTKAAILRGSFSYNYAKNGGGVYANECIDGLLITPYKAEMVSFLSRSDSGVTDASEANSYTTIQNNTCSVNGAGLNLASDATLKNVKILNNVSGFDGGGVCVQGGKSVTMTGLNTIQGNVAANYGGGAIVLTTGRLTVEGNAAGTNKTVITQNKITGSSSGGAGVHVATGSTFTMSYGVITNNDASHKADGSASSSHGGGLDITGGFAALTNVTVSGNKSGGNGGGIALNDYGNDQGSLEVTNCVISGNSSGANGGGISVADHTTSTVGSTVVKGNTAANGGGVFVVDYASVGMTNSYIVENTANGTMAEEGTTLSDTVSGVGGGVAVFNGSSFSLTGTGAIYNNTASVAANDVFANGSSTSLNIPSASAMDTDGATINGVTIAAFDNKGMTVGWWEDYKNGEDNYTSGLYGDVPPAFRYADSPVSIAAYTTAGESANGRYINESGRFVSITFDVQKYNVGSITITAPEADDANQRFVFTVSGTTIKGEKVDISLSIAPGQSVTVEKLYPGTYTVTQKTSWSWRYDFNGAVVDGGTVQTGSESVLIEIVGTSVVEVHTVEYTNDKETNLWLSYNSPVVTNRASVLVAYTLDVTEEKRRHLI